MAGLSSHKLRTAKTAHCMISVQYGVKERYRTHWSLLGTKEEEEEEEEEEEGKVQRIQSQGFYYTHANQSDLRGTMVDPCIVHCDHETDTAFSVVRQLTLLLQSLY